MANGAIDRLVCLSHPGIKPVFGEERRTVRIALAGPKALDTDFCIAYRSEDINEPQVFLQPSIKYPEEVAALVSFFPDFTRPPKKSKEQAMPG